MSFVSGVEPILCDMCPNSCMAYTGPCSDLNTCLECGHARYKQKGGKTVPQRQFYTIPLGAQLQGLWRWRLKECAQNMRYWWDFTKDLLAKIAANPNQQLDTYNNIFSGMEYLQAIKNGHITEDDMVLMFSMDGAQLYKLKKSDCWIYIWVILNHSPDVCYKKKYVLPGGCIGGPNNPKLIKSFIFPGLYHLAALMREGLQIWNVSKDI